MQANYVGRRSPYRVIIIIIIIIIITQVYCYNNNNNNTWLYNVVMPDV